MKKSHVYLPPEERQQLKRLLSKGSLPVKKFKRANALLQLHAGQTVRAVAENLQVTSVTIARWRDVYHAEGLQVLEDCPRPGRRPVITGEQKAKITALACSEPPEGHARWSVRLLAAKAVELGCCEHLSKSWVSEILKKTPCSRT